MYRDMINAKKQLESIIFNNGLTEQSFSLFLEIINQVTYSDEYGFNLLETLKPYTNLETGYKHPIPEYKIPFLMDLVKIVVTFSINGYNVSEADIRTFKSTLKSNYELSKILDRDLGKHENLPKKTLTLNDPKILYEFNYDYNAVGNMLIPIMIKSLGVVGTACYFYFLCDFACEA